MRHRHRGRHASNPSTCQRPPWQNGFWQMICMVRYDSATRAACQRSRQAASLQTINSRKLCVYAYHPRPCIRFRPSTLEKSDNKSPYLQVRSNSVNTQVLRRSVCLIRINWQLYKTWSTDAGPYRCSSAFTNTIVGQCCLFFRIYA